MTVKSIEIATTDAEAGKNDKSGTKEEDKDYVRRQRNGPGRQGWDL
jgi:hypothetical protein